MRVVTTDDAIRERQTLTIIGLLAIIAVFVVAWLLYNSSNRNEVAYNQPPAGYGQQPGVPGGPITPAPGVVPPTAPAGPGAGPQNAAPAPPVARSQAPLPPAQPKLEPPKSATVLGSVAVTYPGAWTLSTSAGGAALLTNGKGTLEIDTADPTATDAKSAADLALANRAANGEIKAQGARSLSGHDAYAYLVSTSVGTIRIVGVDAPTRLVIVETAKNGQFADQKAAFDKIESSLRFK